MPARAWGFKSPSDTALTSDLVNGEGFVIANVA
jgi:hypothetical protein